VPGNYTVTVGVMDDDGGVTIGEPTVLVKNTADLILTKTVNPDPASVGEHMTYTMIVTNQGPDLARNVILMDILPANVEIVSATPADTSRNPLPPEIYNYGLTDADAVMADGVINWFLGDVPAGQTYRVDLVVKTHQQGPIKNIAIVMSDELDPNIENNRAEVVSTVGWLPDGPDLQAQTVTLDTVCKQGKNGAKCTASMRVLVANRGNQTANSFVYSVYLSNDNHLSPDDMKLFTKRVKKMAPLQVKWQQQKIQTPPGFTTTGKFLIAVVDEGNLVFEGNETNNILVNGPLP